MCWRFPEQLLHGHNRHQPGYACLIGGCQSGTRYDDRDERRTTLQAGASFSSTKGFTTLGQNPGIINTAGFNVTFSGPNNGSLEQTGAGSLTLSNGAIGKAAADSGTLILPNATSGRVTLLQGGTLRAAGTLTGLTWIGSGSTLDIGGPTAATLSVGTLSSPFFGANSLTVDFGIGATSSDLLNLTGPFPLPQFSPAGALQFEFQNLGGLTTGVDYPVITFANSSVFPPNANIFAFAPDMASNGFDGTFNVTSTGVTVQFTSVPEPSTTAVPLRAGLCLATRGTPSTAQAND